MSVKKGVYSIINTANNKCYVGSSVNIDRRRNSHFHRLKNNKHQNIKLQNAFNKYGEQNFMLNILELVESDESLLEREQYWIDKLNAVDLGYNICVLAGRTLGYRHTKEAKNKIRNYLLNRERNKDTNKKISESKKGKLTGKDSPLYGRTLSEETKDKISAANRGSKNGMFGRSVSEDDKKKLSELFKGKKSSRAVKVVCLDTNETFECITEASEKTGADRRHISAVCRGKRKTAGGLKWSYTDSNGDKQ